MRLAMRFAALSDVGRVRRDNQDSGYAGPHLLAVADGVGGAARGDVASTAAIQQLRSLDTEPGADALEQLTGSIHLAHNRIADLVADAPELDGTSTTTTAVLFDGAALQIAHVGDSRGYLLRDGELRQLTKDHTFVQSLVDEGRITEEDAKVHPHRNLILRAVDGVHEPEPDAATVEVQAGDRILLCSDGCCGVLDDAEMARLLSADSLESAAGALVEAALSAGSTDNVTVVLGEIVEDDGGTVLPGMVVGAAAGEGRPSTWSLLRRRVEEPVTDPEALRYAPLPPRRFVWLRRLALLVVLIALIAAGCVAGYKWTQTRYYVGVSGGQVAIYRGVDWQVPFVELKHVVEISTLKMSSLSQFDAGQVQDGIPVGSKVAGEDKIAVLRSRACTPAPPHPSPTAHPTSRASKSTSGSKTRSKTSPSSKPSPTKKATTRPSQSSSPSSSGNPSCGTS